MLFTFAPSLAGTSRVQPARCNRRWRDAYDGRNADRLTTFEPRLTQPGGIVLDQDLVLKNDELYTAGDIATDGSGERATGLYLRDTRHLNRFSVLINGLPPETLAVQQQGAARATIMSANPVMTLHDGEALRQHQVLIKQEISLDDRLRIRIGLHNFTLRPIALSLGLQVAADFRDIFDIRGFPRRRRGEQCVPSIEGREITLGYTGLDGALVETVVRFDRDPGAALVTAPETEPPDELVTSLSGGAGVTMQTPPAPCPVVRVDFPIVLDAGESWNLVVEVIPHPADDGVSYRHSAPPIWVQTAVTSDNPLFNAVMARSASDFAELQTRFPDGALPAAGIPWYVAPFGRDSLIAGLQTLHLAPERAAGTLRMLATLQGSKIDPAREEEPGKILHEMRYGEMARLHEVPHTPYYGSIDATPLWLWLFAETVTWTGDGALFAELLPNAHRALDWIEHYGDLDGDGLVEYRNELRIEGGIANQVWKDSVDSLNHADGSPVVGPVAAVEVQGYVFAAYRRLAEAARVFGERDLAGRLDSGADALRANVEGAFWMEEEGFYAQALDGGKTMVRSLSSNPGHLLAAGLPSPARAARVIARFHRPEFDCGWGIRTLSSAATTYNPMSYHNGSVWPHDNSLIGAGFFHYADADAGHSVASALLDAAAVDPLDRLPELYCGFARSADLGEAPVAYPVSCSPQAWAAGALPLLLRAMLGLRVDLANRTLLVNPSLPAWLKRVAIHDLRVLGHRGTLEVRCDGDRVTWDSTGLPVAS